MVNSISLRFNSKATIVGVDAKSFIGCSKSSRDFLQLMLDARHPASDTSMEHFYTVSQVLEESKTAANKGLLKKQLKALSNDEIAGQAFLFLIAGYETTNSTLSFATYLLATNPECQEKLLREVDEFFAKHVSRHYA
uniref:Uncharacterized protein n=1 Tax=Sphaerodactylus townsendi TaxID=933632 RepID=A0ACB8FN07_9SAUR